MDSIVDRDKISSVLHVLQPVDLDGLTIALLQNSQLVDRKSCPYYQT
ncbi:hypothetical protein [Phormidesmis priestleyi]